MGQKPLVVYVVDDDLGVRTGLSRFIRAAGLAAEPFESLDEMLAERHRTCDPACVLVDLSESRRGGRPLDARLRERGVAWPLIAISGDERNSAAREWSEAVSTTTGISRVLDPPASCAAMASMFAVSSCISTTSGSNRMVSAIA